MTIHESTKNDEFADKDGDDSELSKYVIFRLGSELYATQLLSIREVVEEPTIKPLPNTIDAFRGVCNLRGQIVGVIDLALLFGVTSTAGSRPVLLVFDSQNGSLATAVDAIQEVSFIAPGDIDRSSHVIAPQNRKNVSGIGKLGNRLVTIVDLKELLSLQNLHLSENMRLLPKDEAA